MQKTPQVIAVIPLSLEVDELIFNLEGFPSSLPLYSMQADKHGKVEIPGLVPKPVKKIGRRGSEEAVSGPLVFPSGDPGVSGDFWAQGCLPKRLLGRPD